MDEDLIKKKFKEKITHQDRGSEKKAKLNLMKLKAKTERLENKATHYKTKYQGTDPEQIEEIRQFSSSETQQFLSTQMGGKLQKWRWKVKKKCLPKNGWEVYPKKEKSYEKRIKTEKRTYAYTPQTKTA